MVTFLIVLGCLLVINLILFKFSVAGGPKVEKSQKRVAPKQTTLNQRVVFERAS
ncbi:hypothetical protein [Leeuwenhoekiella sp. MAR_2009_132]|uniref:hypothetical protein n=1 Tax=unclassified Leeuwenhoekiella TaxID=2615029 RepID=UPI00131F4218|nr:hypothetical protein [Leeuwenhoekiella sp. MAR_2009_132]